MIKFSMSRLEKEPIELEGTEPAELLEVEPTEMMAVSAPVHYELLAKLVSGGALVEGKVTTEVAGLCGRCLQPTKQPVTADHLCLYFDTPDEDELDITEDVRAEILLELPMTLLCSDDCLGLCPQCGADLNTTPCNCEKPETGSAAWGALDNLKL